MREKSNDPKRIRPTIQLHEKACKIVTADKPSKLHVRACNCDLAHKQPPPHWGYMIPEETMSMDPCGNWVTVALPSNPSLCTVYADPLQRQWSLGP